MNFGLLNMLRFIGSQMRYLRFIRGRYCVEAPGLTLMSGIIRYEDNGLAG